MGKKSRGERPPYGFIIEYVSECRVRESDDNTVDPELNMAPDECVDKMVYHVEADETRLAGNCDIDVNECDSSPCQNGATCTDSVARAMCRESA